MGKTFLFSKEPRFFFSVRSGNKMPVGHCIECDKAINRGANLTEYKGFQYHTNCFVCQICAKNITGPQGFINDPVDAKKHYYHDCYEQNVAPRCHKCSKAIVGGEGGVKHRSRPFHKLCFTCEGCEALLADVRFSVEDVRRIWRTRHSLRIPRETFAPSAQIAKNCR